MLTATMHHWIHNISLIRGGMCFAFGNLKNYSENKRLLLSLLQLIHELYTAKMECKGEYFSTENSALLIFI